MWYLIRTFSYALYIFAVCEFFSVRQIFHHVRCCTAPYYAPRLAPLLTCVYYNYFNSFSHIGSMRFIHYYYYYYYFHHHYHHLVRNHAYYTGLQSTDAYRVTNILTKSCWLGKRSIFCDAPARSYFARNSDRFFWRREVANKRQRGTTWHTTSSRCIDRHLFSLADQ